MKGGAAMWLFDEDGPTFLGWIAIVLLGVVLRVVFSYV